MTWQPPIPAGALYRPESLALGSALALLGYCYDRVERDGSISLRLDRAADQMKKPYGTIKDWWALLKTSGIFSDARDQGKKGWWAQFDPNWLDWRIMQHNYGDVQAPVKEDMSALTAQGSVMEEISALNNDEVSVKSPSSLFQGGDVSLDQTCIKVLHVDHDSIMAAAQNAQTAPPPKKRKTKSQAIQEHLPDPIRDVVSEVCGIDQALCTHPQRMQLVQTVKLIRASAVKQAQTDQEIISTVRYVADWYSKHDWRGQKGQKPTPAQLREVWRQAIDHRAKAQARASPPARASPETTGSTSNSNKITDRKLLRQQAQALRNNGVVYGNGTHDNERGTYQPDDARTPE